MQKWFLATLALVLTAASGSASAATDCGASLVPQVKNTNVTANTTWSGVIVLQQPIFVKNGATLTILPGTIIRGQPRSGPVVPGSVAGSPGALIVTQSGRIVANGGPAKDQVIIMTTAAVDNNLDGVPDDADANGFEDAWVAGDKFLDRDCQNHPLAPLNAAGFANVALWGGMIIEGTAPTNLADFFGLGTGLGVVEGLTVPGFPVSDATYGGNETHDSSGTLRYVSIRHAGDEIGEGNELNGLSLAGVGDGTVLEFVEIYCNFDDGIEWFGGTVNGRNLVVAFAGDDTFDQDQGFTGVNQFLFGMMPYFDNNDGSVYGSASGDKAGEWDGDDWDEPSINVNVSGPPSLSTGDPAPWPFSHAFNYNLTIIGSTPDGANPAVHPNTANLGVQMRNGFGGELRNGIVVNTGTKAGFDIPNPPGDGGAPGWMTCQNVTNKFAAVLSSTFQNGAALATPCEDVAIANGDAEALALGGAPVLSANCVNPAPATFAGLVNENDAFLPTGIGGYLDPTLLATPVNPRPVVLASPLCRLGGVVPTGFGLDPAATYRGAFASSAPTLWTTGWTTLSMAGLLAN